MVAINCTRDMGRSQFQARCMAAHSQSEIYGNSMQKQPTFTMPEGQNIVASCMKSGNASFNNTKAQSCCWPFNMVISCQETKAWGYWYKK